MFLPGSNDVPNQYSTIWPEEAALHMIVTYSLQARNPAGRLVTTLEGEREGRSVIDTLNNGLAEVVREMTESQADHANWSTITFTVTRF